MGDIMSRLASLGEVTYDGPPRDDADAIADEPGPVYLWPECVPAWRVFTSLTDQWREGVLPRSEVLAHLREIEPDDATRRDLYECVCACIHATVSVHAEHRKREEKRRSEAAQQRR